MPRTSAVRVDGLNVVLRALRQFPDEAQEELRKEASIIASQVMKPAYEQAASQVPIWGELLAGGIKVRRDRIPAVNIGYARPKLSGGATSAILRHPTWSGRQGDSPAPFEATNWLQEASGYKAEAMSRWGDALERVVIKWNR